MTNLVPDAAADLQDLLDRFGIDLSRWPDTERQRAEQLIAASPDARKVLADARALWDPGRAVPVKAPPGLKDRILNQALSGSDPLRDRKR